MISRTSPEIGGMGHPIKRKEDLRFIQGKGNYVDDVHLPDMVYGHIVRSPYAHARLKSVNTEKAKALPGVLAVITGEDFPAGIADFHTTFLSAPMSRGSAPSSAIPDPLGPRNRCQSPA